ncbi:MAG: hypothetical protein AB4041_17375 [Microcystaceae cyanobacterium]
MVNLQDYLERVAEQFAQDDFFVSEVLQQYCSFEEITRQELASYLEIDEKDIPKLALCRQPNTQDPLLFRTGVERIANHTGANPHKLAKIFREVDAYKATQNLNKKRSIYRSNPQGVLLAARDKTTEEIGKNSQSTSDEENDSDFSTECDPENASNSEDLPIESDEFQEAFGESLIQALDLNTWLPSEDLSYLYERLEKEVEEAVNQENRIRQRIRQEVFPRLGTRPSAPQNAGIYQATPEQIEQVHKKILFPGYIEACDGTSVSHDTLALTIAQIGICTISYQGKQGAYVHHLYRRDLRVKGLDPVEEALELLDNRWKRDGFDISESKRDKLSNLARRGIMTYAERAVLVNMCQAPWRMGHGNPIAYELLTGSGMPELIKRSLKVLKNLVAHKKFVFIPSSTSDRALLTIGNALRPLEYAIVETSKRFTDNVLDGHFTGQWAEYLPELRKFSNNESQKIIRGIYRVSSAAPAQVFFAHIDHAHEAALIAMADSILHEHRGFPMLIDLADSICSTTFGADTFKTATQLAYSNTPTPFQYFTERQTREFVKT